MSKYLLFRIILRVLKEDSVFAYFLLEACEGLCFYSTIKSSEKKVYRDIELLGSYDFLNETKMVIESMKGLYPVEVLSDELLES